MDGGPTFAQQRLIAVALLLGMTFYAVVVAIVLQSNGGRGLAVEPIAVLDTVVLVVGASMAVTAFVLRSLLNAAADRAAPELRPLQRFRAVLVPLAAIEGACLFALTVWMLNGRTVPTLAVAMVLLALAIVIVPFSDPDADRS
ncbi:MAG: hypothetical protein JNM25_07940 [Planctomycetes bacterium]|nr:hypothetical protein [Planctomycetota bacterium]